MDFEYTVETEESTTPQWAEQKINRALQVAFVNSLAESHCPRRQRQRQLRQRQLEVAAIAANTTPEQLGSCEMTEAKSKSCLLYKGYLTVDYTSEGGNSNETDVVNSVRSALQTNMDGDFYLKEVNAAIVDSGFVLTNIAYVENNNNTMNNSDVNAVAGLQSSTTVVNENGLSALEKGMIGLGLVALLVLILLLIFCCRRRRANLQNTNASDDDKHCTRSVNTDGSSVDGKENKSSQEEVKEADYNHLGARHNRLDVHNCKSASCPECVSGPSRSCDKQVKFVPLATHGPLARRMFGGDGRDRSKGVPNKASPNVETTARRQVVL